MPDNPTPTEDNIPLVSNAARHCPKCGFHANGVLSVTIAPYVGDYCLRCYAEWISKNIPMLIKEDE